MDFLNKEPTKLEEFLEYLMKDQSYAPDIKTLIVESTDRITDSLNRIADAIERKN
jgi:hypothetical protein